MTKEITIPQISEGVESAQVTEILVSEGDNIKEEQSIIAVETDKASVEVPSSDSGKVKEIKVKEGDEVKVGDVILVIEEEEEEGEKEEKDKKKKDSDDLEGKKKKDEEKEDQAEKKKEKEKEGIEAKEKEKGKEEDKEKDKGDEDLDAIPASPAVRRLAREMGVNIKDVEGSGPEGRITEEDIKAKADKKEDETDKEDKKAKGKRPAQPSLPDFSKWGQVERQSLSNIRMTTAKNTTASWQTIPHVFQFDEADISGIEEYMEKNSKKAEEAGGKLTITAILTKIAASALQQFPKFNASIDMENQEVILKKYVHIGIAVDTEKGLLVPVIRDVDKKSIIELAVEITKMAEKARAQKLSPEDMQGGNLAISNLGGIGGTNFTPIVYHPQVAILGVSKVKTQPVYIDGNFEPRQILPLSLSYDHRLIDGAEGARFINWITQALEDPYKALLGA